MILKIFDVKRFFDDSNFIALFTVITNVVIINSLKIRFYIIHECA